MRPICFFPVFILGFASFLISCSKEPKKVGSQPDVVVESVMMPVETRHADSTINDTVPQSNEAETVVSTAPVNTTTYDEGYLDGEAMAEEDRLAGRPGMQVGMDDDDDDNDDYEDGFDDGYED